MSTDEPEPRSPYDADEPLVSSADRSVSGSEPAGAVSEPASSSPLVSPASPAVDERAEVESYEPQSQRARSTNMLPQDRRRSPVERLLVRLIATCGIVAIGVAIAAIMVSSKSQGWIIGLVVSIVTVVLAALLWSSRTL